MADVVAEQVAAWAIASYRGDASFIFGANIASGSLASTIFTGLQAHFLRRMFLIDIGVALAGDEPCVTCEMQERAQEIWSDHAEAFLLAMFEAHDQGQILFGEHTGDPVGDWIRANG